jgi:hypothetical protein
VLALRVPAEVSRADLRDVLGGRLGEEGLLAEEAILDHMQPLVDPSPEPLELADRFVARLRAYLGSSGSASLTSSG